MKKLNNYILRSESVITGKSNLEPLHVLHDFPVFMGCVETSPDEDIVADMDWGICPETGIIQLTRMIPLETLYLNNHNDGVGKIWEGLYDHTADFIERYALGNNILEIGGAHDLIATRYLRNKPNASWTIVEPNPEQIHDPRIKVIKAWFDNNFTLAAPVDTIVHSHVLEHTYNPREFLQDIGKFLKTGRRHIFAFPNMLPMLEKKFTNCLNFEHTVFLTEYFADYLLSAAGFKIIAKEFYGDPHSILYATEKVDMTEDCARQLENKYDEYRAIFMDFVRYHEDVVREINQNIESAQGDIYLFGAHVFSQYLIAFGLRTNKILSVLDNSTMKLGKRLYGTILQVESPKILTGRGRVNVILKAGIYNEEIKKDILKNINSEVIFW